MTLAVLSCLLGLLVAEAVGLGYHEDIGIPEATRIRQAETRVIASRIIGGTNAQWGENPYLAGILITLVNGKMSVCGGTLLSSTRVLTAGQCLYDGYMRYKRVHVILDRLLLFGASKREVASIAVHPDFDPLIPVNDLAMLTLTYSVYFYRDVMPASLPLFNETRDSFVGVTAKVSGFGTTSDWSPIGPTQRQQAVSVPVIDFYDCYASLGPNYNQNATCTRGVTNWGENIGACAGDLGGPLVVSGFNGTNKLIGVVSMLSPVGCENGFPTGYMSVPAYLNWIQSNL